MLNYQSLIEKISKASGLSVEDVDRRVEAKRAKLSGLISKEGSAQIVASELGINFEKEKMKIGELVSGMKKVNVVGKIIGTLLIRSFNKNDRQGKVLSMTLADDTNNMRVVLWDINHIALFEDKKLKENDIVEISNASVKNEELHLGSFSDIKKSSEVFSEVITDRKLPEKNISELQSGQNVKIRAFIMQMFEPRFFELCPECHKKTLNNECPTHGTIASEKRSLISLVLDDGTDNIRGVLFEEQIEKIGISKEEINNPEFFTNKKNELLGNEFIFSVSLRNNKVFNTNELSISNIEKPEIEVLIENLKNAG